MQGWNIQRPSRLHRQEIVACGHHARTVCPVCAILYGICAPNCRRLFSSAEPTVTTRRSSPTKASKVRKAVP